MRQVRRIPSRDNQPSHRRLGWRDPEPQKKGREHILTKQVFGIGITKLTSMLARRSVYCSKHANGKHSIARSFKSDLGNIWFERTEHASAGTVAVTAEQTDTERTGAGEADGLGLAGAEADREHQHQGDQRREQVARQEVVGSQAGERERRQYRDSEEAAEDRRGRSLGSVGPQGEQQQRPEGEGHREHEQDRVVAGQRVLGRLVQPSRRGRGGRSSCSGPRPPGRAPAAPWRGRRGRCPRSRSRLALGPRPVRAGSPPHPRPGTRRSSEFRSPAPRPRPNRRSTATGASARPRPTARSRARTGGRSSA